MAGMEKVRHAPGELIDFETLFVKYRAFENGVPAKRGRVERVDYTSNVYEDGKVYDKYCNVYLPWCYDPGDSSRKYNVLYYQHGNTCDPEIFTGENQRLFDILFDDGTIDPCIIVSTTYYFDVARDVDERRRTGLVPAGDGGGDATAKPNFWKEYIEKIIPAVELRYNTYLEEGTKEAVIASRDHRAVSGYSRGCVFTWSMFHNAFEYFRWYAPMSCMTTAGHRINEPVTREEVISYLTEPVKAHPGLPFFIFASNGGEKDVKRMDEQMAYITRQGCFSYGTDPIKNSIYYCVSDFPHTDLLVPYYYYNSLRVIFRA